MSETPKPLESFVRNLLLICLITFIAACNSETSKAEAENATPPPEETKETSHESHEGHEGHSHTSSLVTTGYEEVEALDNCEQPTVIEFFAYQCPHCYKLEEHLVKWKNQKSDQVKFIAIPTDLGREQFTVFVASHYIAEEFGVLDKVKPELFAVIHEQKKIDNVLDVFVNAGIEKEKAEKAFQNSEAIRKNIVNGYELMKRYKVTGVPKVLVNYQYGIDVTSAGGYDKVFDVVEDTLKLTASCKEVEKQASAQ